MKKATKTAERRQPMASDKRLWAKVDLGYLTNPKMSEVLDESTTAPLMHLASILHCAQHLTDGEASPRAMMRMVGGNAQDIDLLVKNGLWHEPRHECAECPQPEEGRIYVHNYLNHNVSSDKVSEKSEKARQAANERWAKERNAQGMQDASDAHTKRNARSDQIRSDQNTAHASDDAPKKRSTKKSDNAHNEDPDFTKFWEAYPLKKDKKRAYEVFVKVIEKVDLETLIQGAINYTNDPTRNPTHTRHASTWLNNNNWEDSPNVTAVPPPQHSNPDDPRNWNQPAPWL